MSRVRRHLFNPADAHCCYCGWDMTHPFLPPRCAGTPEEQQAAVSAIDDERMDEEADRMFADRDTIAEEEEDV